MCTCMYMYTRIWSSRLEQSLVYSHVYHERYHVIIIKDSPMENNTPKSDSHQNYKIRNEGDRENHCHTHTYKIIFLIICYIIWCKHKNLQYWTNQAILLIQVLVSKIIYKLVLYISWWTFKINIISSKHKQYIYMYIYRPNPYLSWVTQTGQYINTLG